MTRDVHAALAQYGTDWSVERELHRVPPHVTYEVVVDGRRAVCKLATSDEGAPATEARVMERLARGTAVPVPWVLGGGEGSFVAEWSDDVPTGARADETWARAAGRGMARLHAETEGLFDRTGFPRAVGDGLAVDSHATWAGTVEAFVARRRDFLTGRGHEEPAAVAEAVRRFVGDHPEAFGTADPPVLCHGDWHPDHVGVADGRTVAVVDFEHALVAPPAYDYWRTALPVFTARDRPDLDRAFRAGYASVRPLPDGADERAAAYRMVNTVSYLRSLFLQERHGPEETARYAEWMRDRIREELATLRDRYD